MNFYDLTRHRFKTYRAGQLIRIMRLTIIIITALFIQVSAKSVAQKVTISAKNAPLLQLFNELRLQTGYDFLYSDEMLKMAKPVTINAKQQQLETVLKQIFNSQRLVYVLKNKAVIVAMKEESLLDIVNSYFARIDVRGKVSDEKGKPLPGATVKVKNSDRIVITDANGSFVFTGIDEKVVLVISYLGYKTKEVPVKGIMSINLESADSDLEEVGVISTGYQKIKKDQLTGAASTINEKQYQQREAITGNFLESLEGKVPGLVYNGQTGELTIRGVSTFDAVKQPLIVLDGFPTEIDLRTINPNDIVSVSVLRDAASAAIYGVRASNGVIIVETRRGKVGKPVFNLRSSLAIQSKPDFSYLNYAPASEFVQLQKENFYTAKPSYTLFQLGYSKMNPAQEILFAGPRTGVTNPVLSQAQVDEKLLALGAHDNLNDYERLFYQQRQARNVNFDVSGGGGVSTYMLGINYVAETPVNRRSENKQFILNVANTYKFSQRFNLDFKGTYTNGVFKSGNTPEYSDFYPYEHLVDGNGNALPVSMEPYRTSTGKVVTPVRNAELMAAGLPDQFYYPYRELNSNTNALKQSSVRFQGRLNAKITNWLNADVGGNYEHQNGLSDQLQLEDSYAAVKMVSTMALKDLLTGKAIFSNMPQGNILKRQNQKLTNYTLRAQLNLSHKFGEDHDLSGIFGAEQKRTLNQGYTTTFFGYDGQSMISKPINMGELNNAFLPAFDNIGYASFKNTDYFGETESERRFLSFYGQGTYIYKAKYVATGSFRIDKSNLFGVDPKYRNKPLWSAGVNWRVGEEDFVKKLDWINQLQFRAATGFNGNVPTSNNGSFLILKTGLNTLLNVPLISNTVLSPENQSLRWETTKNYNLGLDYTLFNHRISGSVDWYLKKATDVFGEFDADPTSGFNHYMANTASIENRGFEFMVNTQNVKSGRFGWNTQLTASFNQNKVLDVKATEFSNSEYIVSRDNSVKGMPLGALYSYNYGGLNAAGQPYVLDKSGNQKILAFYGNSKVDVTQEDLIYNGTTTPKYVLGLNNQFSIGSFDISALFMYYGGHVMRVEQPNPNNIGGYTNNPLTGSSNFWKKTGDEANTRVPGYVRASSVAPGYYQTYALYGYQYASEFVRKADYIRLRDVVVTYHANAPFIQKLGLKNTQLRLQVQNAFRYTFSGNDIDPDAINRLTGVRTLENQPLYSLTFLTNF
ncbi:SusC/RagA family TonB-linked outer membrane protein [Pedobacter hiemivivus]|uniref:SusC/RagA family TonB-linked outer membrane protein n=1 Tax=Pedobacter hiemivivus TaxID=2530454 RepID=A0A4U1GN09_9SPHI|nr:SusC/RagA family TonB-linked outer membrane protein [Pedobacter hiemivivus]TKC65414.1 SusC/RagA family TonB-linked outer membrane protein [Pedobacter hiemivivus]